jgi:hypothetical protein
MPGMRIQTWRRKLMPSSTKCGLPTFREKRIDQMTEHPHR